MNRDTIIQGINNYYNNTTKSWIETFKAHRIQSFRWDKNLQTHDDINMDLMGLSNGQTVLDAGCGVGEPMITYAKTFSKSTFFGININDHQLRLIKKRTKNTFFLKGDFHKLPFKDNYFDIVYFIESFSHSYSKKGLVKEVFRVLKKGGRVYIFDHVLTNNNLNKLHIHHQLCYHYPESVETIKKLFSKYKNIFFYDKLRDVKDFIVDADIDPDKFYCYYKDTDKLTPFGIHHSILVKESAYIMKPVAYCYEK